MTYIGAEVIISPLGESAETNWSAVYDNRSGISLVESAGFDGESVYLSKILDFTADSKFAQLLIKAMEKVSAGIDDSIITSDKTIVIISSTKGELDRNINDQFGGPVAAITERFHLANEPIVISNACISGVLAINAASNFIDAHIYEHAIVIGCDVISDFVVYGFQSLFAISDKPCAPFDNARNGITMGEGCGAVVVSASRGIYKNPPMDLLSGTTANDANHISGPSRTGEGLFRSVKKTMDSHQISSADIDFISAHGTATVFNDEMESIAFDRLGLSDIPLNSMKGYFGHTLGAAGVIETTASMQMIRNGVLLKSLGYQEAGTSKALNIISENRKAELKTILKTASGFGGGNASLIIRSI
ncbi:beta-ketoacyl-[acyl-carrier-protein] synthase family protein [Dyadobacter pollutisoli]|jgi:3-oxoacyl-[acyl-carrier-protein] synthase-1|uniref:Beta-ketoacyl synthase N-terminal-like domain-containing protein n=1 Tax=Dyadobacter pollutisoli TaxID=2910158 RepID=A0A9E8NGX0_9BACT|nr:beta-ketoacyl synthase N-terminal-like domain-containing protein [Dyadobacter pollutisoli]WAC15088.1 beta-ketoacyl synthase N-terminal-like domain-containing protein [Dyadobacter pollutisoli]